MNYGADNLTNIYIHNIYITSLTWPTTLKIIIIQLSSLDISTEHPPYFYVLHTSIA